MTDRVRFHLDEHVAFAVAVALRKHGIDVTSTKEAGLIGATIQLSLSMLIGRAG